MPAEPTKPLHQFPLQRIARASLARVDARLKLSGRARARFATDARIPRAIERSLRLLDQLGYRVPERLYNRLAQLYRRGRNFAAAQATFETVGHIAHGDTP